MDPRKIQERIFVQINPGCKLQDSEYHLFITCPNCKKFYIGRATNFLWRRASINRQHIRQGNMWKILLNNNQEIGGEGNFKSFPFTNVQMTKDFRMKLRYNSSNDSLQSYKIWKWSRKTTFAEKDRKERKKNTHEHPDKGNEIWTLHG